MNPSFGQCGLHSYAEGAVEAFGRTWAHDGRCECRKSRECILSYKNRYKELTSIGTDRINNNFLNVEGIRQGQLKNEMNLIKSIHDNQILYIFTPSIKNLAKEFCTLTASLYFDHFVI